jgi:hypothetical protein
VLPDGANNNCAESVCESSDTTTCCKADDGYCLFQPIAQPTTSTKACTTVANALQPMCQVKCEGGSERADPYTADADGSLCTSNGGTYTGGAQEADPYTADEDGTLCTANGGRYTAGSTITCSTCTNSRVSECKLLFTRIFSLYIYTQLSIYISLILFYSLVSFFLHTSFSFFFSSSFTRVLCFIFL